MLTANRFFQGLRRLFLSLLLAGLLALTSLPTFSVQALPLTNSSDLTDNLRQNREAFQNTSESYIESAERAANNIPKDLGNNNKDVGERVQRAIDELGNDQIQRAFGADDYKRSEAEQTLTHNQFNR